MTNVSALICDLARLRSRALSSSFFLSSEDFKKYVQIEFITRVRLSGLFDVGRLVKVLMFEVEVLLVFGQFGESRCMRLSLRFEWVIIVSFSAGDCVGNSPV